MTPSIRPIWEERLVCRRCGKEYSPVSGAIQRFVAEEEGPNGYSRVTRTTCVTPFPPPVGSRSGDLAGTGDSPLP